MDKLHYYKRTVPYVVGGRWDITDSRGFTLTTDNPYIAVSDEKLRDFKNANKTAILKGLMIPTEEPSIDWETPNAISDERATELVKLPFFALKKEIELITSMPTMQRIVEIAKELNKPKKTLKLLEDHLEKVSEPYDDFSYKDSREVKNS